MKLKDKPTKKEIIKIIEAIGLDLSSKNDKGYYFRDKYGNISERTEVFINIPKGCTYKEMLILIKEMLYCYIP